SESKGIQATQPMSDHETLLQKNMFTFVETMASLVPEAHNESSEIRQSGFELGVFQVGIGISLGGDIGVANAQASAVGRVIFKKDSLAAPSALALSMDSST